MQVQYRETKTGFECIHMPSIDVSSIQPPATSNHQKRPSTSSHEDKRTLAKKSSKRSFGMRNKERERDAKDKELPSRPSGGTILSTTASSASSSFFHVSSNAHTATVEPARSDTLENLAAPDESAPRPQSPTKGKNLPPIPRDFAASPQPTLLTPLPTGEVGPDIFEIIGANSLAVRFEINVVKVRSSALRSLLKFGHSLNVSSHAGTLASASWDPVPQIERRRLAIPHAGTASIDRVEAMTIVSTGSGIFVFLLPDSCVLWFSISAFLHPLIASYYISPHPRLYLRFRVPPSLRPPTSSVNEAGYPWARPPCPSF